MMKHPSYLILFLHSFLLVIIVGIGVKPTRLKKSNFEWNFPRFCISYSLMGIGIIGIGIIFCGISQICISCPLMSPKRLLVCAFLGEIVPSHLTAHQSLSVR